MKPLLANTQVAQNILAGRQTQDRRPIKPQPVKQHGKMFINQCDRDDWAFESGINGSIKTPIDHSEIIPKFAKYQVGDILYVRETMVCERELPERLYFDVLYSADRTHIETPVGSDDQTEWFMQYKQWWSRGEDKVVIPSIHMPKWAARIFLKVTGVRVERVKDITQADAKSEGVISFTDQGRVWHRNYLTGKDFYGYGEYRDSFQSLWESIYPGSWERNDFVFVYEFEKYERQVK